MESLGGWGYYIGQLSHAYQRRQYLSYNQRKEKEKQR